VRGSGGAPKAREDSAKEEDGEEADKRRMGRRSPGGRGRSGREPPAFRGLTAADRQRGEGARAPAGQSTTDTGRLAVVENPGG
jgi:hypothetical protein